MAKEFDPIRTLTVEEFKNEFKVKGNLKLKHNSERGTFFYVWTNEMNQEIVGPASSKGINGKAVICEVEDTEDPSQTVFLMCNEGSVETVAEF